MQIVIRAVSPTEAQSALDFRASNRTPRKAHIENLARDMVQGNWQMNGAPIVFDSAGRLIDGQHRMAACVKSGVTFQTAVLSGVVGDVVGPTIDTGKARSFGDALRMRRTQSYASETASAVRHLLAVHNDGTISSVKNATHSQLTRFMESKLDADRLADAIATAVPAKVYVPIAPLAALLYTSEQSPEVKSAFCDTLGAGIGAYRGHPALTFREWVTKARAKRVTIRAEERFNALCYAWNAYTKGKTMRAVITKSRPFIS